MYDEPDTRYVFTATKDLREESMRKVRLLNKERLVGLVAHKEEPLNLPDADQYPNFAYFEETGESSFHSFLGVPIIHHRRVLVRKALKMDSAEDVVNCLESVLGRPQIAWLLKS